MTDVLDMEVIAELLAISGDDDPELLLDLIEMFLEDAPVRIRELQDNLQSGDLEAVAATAHSLKGSAGNLGIALVQEDCDVLQIAGKQHQAETVRERLPRLEQNMSAALDALRQLQAGYQ